MHCKTPIVVGGIVYAVAGTLVAYAMNPPDESALHFDPPADRPASAPSRPSSTFPDSATSPRFRDGDGYTVTQSSDTIMLPRPPERS
jgi:hypothetical protein